MNYKGDCRTAPATPGLLIIWDYNLGKTIVARTFTFVTAASERNLAKAGYSQPVTVNWYSLKYQDLLEGLLFPFHLISPAPFSFPLLLPPFLPYSPVPFVYPLSQPSFSCLPLRLHRWNLQTHRFFPCSYSQSRLFLKWHTNSTFLAIVCLIFTSRFISHPSWSIQNTDICFT